MNYKIVARFIGLLLLVEGVVILIALGVAFFSGGSDVLALLYSSLLCIVPGLALTVATTNSDRSFSKREGYLIVSLSWIILSLFGTLPFLLSGAIPRVTDAFFETMSGFTTTGASVVDNIESFPKGILFWRSMTQWLGGMGIVVLMLTLLPSYGISGLQLYESESPGISVDRLSPHIYQTARKVWLLYLVFTAMETLLLTLGGMSLFDSVCHSFTCMATGGFSTKQASVDFWPSSYIQYVFIFFMMIAGTNFALLYFAVKGKFSKLIHDEEFRFYLLFILIFTVAIFIGLLITSDSGVENAFRNSLFNVVSIITTTGFVTIDYLQWTPVLYIFLFGLFFFGGSTGSTGGGIKIMRIVLLLKNSYYELRRIIHPNAVIPVRFNNHSVEVKTINNVLAFFMFYMLVFFFSSVVIMIFEPDLKTAMGAVGSCLGNIGPGLGSVGPVFTYSHLHDVAKWFLSFLMMLGRLELFTVLVIFTPSFWIGR